MQSNSRLQGVSTKRRGVEKGDTRSRIYISGEM